MKKIHLSIPKPCHENWDAMTQVDKGKFCASCQKTVIDFTAMSDRQLAEFFKKPPASVCGRVYNDQLNRDFEIPKKRIPWIRYFFQFTWPAFVFLLKSCGVKENTKGKVKLESKASRVEPPLLVGTVGMILPEITPVDTSMRIIEENIVTQGEIVGDIEISPKVDTVEKLIDTLGEVVYKPMDTVVVVAYPSIECRSVVGAISVCKVENVKAQSDSLAKESALASEFNFKLYPNPVRTGGILNISVEDKNNLPEQIQILSSSGQLVSQVKQKENKAATVTTIQIPSNITAGVYFLQMITKTKEVKTAKVIVTN